MNARKKCRSFYTCLPTYVNSAIGLEPRHPKVNEALAFTVHTLGDGLIIQTVATRLNEPSEAAKRQSYVP